MTHQYANWRPTAKQAARLLRARTLARLRQFFAERDVLEVETPLLSAAATVDPNIHSFRTHYDGPGGERTLYLATSPEFAMKRLLADGSGPIYQVCKAFRQGEAGDWHNPEFTLLEWYRPGFDHHRLMSEVEALVRCLAEDILPLAETDTLTYGEAFQRELQLDPHTASLPQLRQCAANVLGEDLPHLGEDRDAWLDLLMSHCVQPNLGQGHLTFVHEYPASQAALARIRPGTPPVAERFELFYAGVELANGFHELTHAGEQKARFEEEQCLRQKRSLSDMPMDEHLLAALDDGMPDCAGVAMGLDRILLLLQGGTNLSETLNFPIDRA
jgi:lysyl-tRNA synthetase class 2